MGVCGDEVAFYDVLATNDSAVQPMGDAKLKLITAELITQVKKSVSIDWTLRESARARIRVMVKNVLVQAEPLRALGLVQGCPLLRFAPRCDSRLRGCR